MNSWELNQVSLGISALWILITRTITVGIVLRGIVHTGVTAKILLLMGDE